jgi:hypothetical protein
MRLKLGDVGMGRQAFTAIELCVVLVLIAILAIILMPALEEGRVKAIETKCLGRVHQMGISFVMYQNAQNGDWPYARVSVREDHPEWPDPTGSLALLYPAYAPQIYLFQCPNTSDIVAVDDAAHDFANCSNWYVSPQGSSTRPEDQGKLPPRPPSYFYDAGSNGLPGIPRDAPGYRAVYGDNCIHGVLKDEKNEKEVAWLGKDNHEGGGNFLFGDKHAGWLAQQWAGRPYRLGRGVPSVPNPNGGPGYGADPNVFTDDPQGPGRYSDAHLSGMMWANGEWMEN